MLKLKPLDLKMVTHMPDGLLITYLMYEDGQWLYHGCIWDNNNKQIQSWRTDSQWKAIAAHVGKMLMSDTVESTMSNFNLFFSFTGLRR